VSEKLTELYIKLGKYQAMLDKQIRSNEWNKPMPRGRIIAIKGDIEKQINEILKGGENSE